jgi:hypothetical protein
VVEMYVIYEYLYDDVNFICIVETKEDADRYCKTMNLVHSDTGISYEYELVDIKNVDDLLQNTYDEYKLTYYKDFDKITVEVDRVTIEDTPPSVSIIEEEFFNRITLTAYEKYTKHHKKNLYIKKYQDIIEKKVNNNNLKNI